MELAAFEACFQGLDMCECTQPCFWHLGGTHPAVTLPLGGLLSQSFNGDPLTVAITYHLTLQRRTGIQGGNLSKVTELRREILKQAQRG